jgi:hypothetical protein
MPPDRVGLGHLPYVHTHRTPPPTTLTISPAEVPDAPLECTNFPMPHCILLYTNLLAVLKSPVPLPRGRRRAAVAPHPVRRGAIKLIPMMSPNKDETAVQPYREPGPRPVSVISCGNTHTLSGKWRNSYIVRKMAHPFSFSLFY